MAIGSNFYPVSQGQSPVQSCRTEGKLLIVSADATMRRSLHGTLFHLGFDIGEASSAEEALAICRILHYDAILMDAAGLHGKTTMEMYSELRLLHPQVAILTLGANDHQDGSIEALEAGADAWLTRSFQMRELTARLRTVLHRTVGEPRIPQAVVIGELSLNLARRLVQKSGNRIHLTPKEFELLHCLMTHPGIPVSYSRLIHTLWGEDYATQMDGLRTLVRQLRKKIENDPAAPRYILTESRIGYRFADPEDWLEDSLGIPQ